MAKDRTISGPTARIDGQVLVIEMPLQTPTPSASGKTLVVASTRGNIVTEAVVGSKPIKIGVNAYIAKD